MAQSGGYAKNNLFLIFLRTWDILCDESIIVIKDSKIPNFTVVKYGLRLFKITEIISLEPFH